MLVSLVNCQSKTVTVDLDTVISNCETCDSNSILIKNKTCEKCQTLDTFICSGKGNKKKSISDILNNKIKQKNALLIYPNLSTLPGTCLECQDTSFGIDNFGQCTKCSYKKRDCDPPSA